MIISQLAAAGAWISRVVVRLTAAVPHGIDRPVRFDSLPIRIVVPLAVGIAVEAAVAMAANSATNIVRNPERRRTTRLTPREDAVYSKE